MVNTSANVKLSNQQWLTLLGISLATFMFSLDIHIVNLALPTLVKDLNTNFSTVEWVPLSYSLVLSALVLCIAQLGDILSKKKLYLLGLLTFAASSLVCGLAPTIQVLILARVFQGFGAVLIAVLTPVIATDIFPNEKIGFVLGIITSIGWVGVSLGPTLGGILIGNFGWRSTFLVNIPICLLSILLIILKMPGNESIRESKPFDFLGALILVIALVCFVLGMDSAQKGESFQIVGLLLGFSAAGGFFFFWSQSRVEYPLLNLKLIQSWKLSLRLILSSIAYAFSSSVIFTLPFFLEIVTHYPVQKVGIMLCILPITAICMGPGAGYLADKFGEEGISTLGLVMLVIGCWGLSTFSETLTVPGYLLRVIPIAIGIGIFQPPNQSAIMKSVSSEFRSAVSGLLFFSRSFGQVIGLTSISILLSKLTASQVEDQAFISITSAPIEALVFGEQTSFRIVTSILVIALAISAFIWQRQQTTFNHSLPPQ